MSFVGLKPRHASFSLAEQPFNLSNGQQLRGESVIV